MSACPPEEDTDRTGGFFRHVALFVVMATPPSPVGRAGVTSESPPLPGQDERPRSRRGAHFKIERLREGRARGGGHSGSGAVLFLKFQPRTRCSAAALLPARKHRRLSRDTRPPPRKSSTLFLFSRAKRQKRAGAATLVRFRTKSVEQVEQGVGADAPFLTLSGAENTISFSFCFTPVHHSLRLRF